MRVSGLVEEGFASFRICAFGSLSDCFSRTERIEAKIVCT